MDKGLDWSWARPPISDMPRWGYHYFFRYICYKTPSSLGKIITPTEMHELLQTLDGWLNWEWYSNRAKEGAIAGRLDGHEAHNQLAALGWPKGSVIPVSDDSGTTGPGNIAAVLAYLDAFQANCPGYVVVPYGNDYLVTAWYNHTKRLGWQTLAWSGGRISPHVFAYQNGNQAYNKGADENIIYSAYGSYRSTMAPPPPPLPPLPIHLPPGGQMYGFIHRFAGSGKGWPGVWVVSPDLSSRTHITETKSLAFLVTSKLYPPSGLSDVQVSSIPIRKA